jgi:hypothetical protein
MRDPELVARAGYAAARLEQAWERWRALHGLGGSADPLASYVGYSLKEPMGQPRVVIGVDAAEAESFADFLENHDCSGMGADGGPAADAGALTGAGLTAGDPRPVSGATHSQASGPMHSQASGPMHSQASGPMHSQASGPMHSQASGPMHSQVNGPMHPPVGSPLHPQGSGPMHPPVSGPMHPPVSGPQPVLANGAPRPSGPAAAPGPLSTGPGAVPGAFGAGSADGADARGSGAAASPVSRNTEPGTAPSRWDVPPEPMVRRRDGADTGTRPDLLSAPIGAEHPVDERSSASAPVTRVFPAIPADPPGNPGAPAAPQSAAPRSSGAPDSYAEHSDYLRRTGRLGPAEYPAPGEPMSGPQEAPDAMAAELAGWASGELPGQASEQLASWVAGDSGGRRLRRSRSAR